MSPPWLVRTARKTKRDRGLLHAFSCVDMNVPWQTEVERFIRDSLFDWTFDAHARTQDPRMLLLFQRATKALLGVAAHERTTLQHGDDEPFSATKLEVVAVSNAWQGRRFETGERVSDVLMSAVMVDITSRVPPRHARVFTVIHEANLRSIALARRHGFVHDMSRPDPAYRRLVTEHC